MTSSRISRLSFAVRVRLIISLSTCLAQRIAQETRPGEPLSTGPNFKLRHGPPVEPPFSSICARRSCVDRAIRLRSPPICRRAVRRRSSHGPRHCRHISPRYP
jgi:hypothetical protein